MKQKHLYSLLDQSYTTIKVIFTQEQVLAQRTVKVTAGASPPPPKQGTPWTMPEDRYEGRSYTYKAPRDAGVQVDDFVVVYTDSRGLCIARVVEVHETPQIDVDAPYDYKWIVQRIDRDGYQARVQAERTFADAMLEIERVRQKELMLQGFHSTLPEGSEARKLFDRTVQSLQAPTIDQPPAAPQA